MLRFILTTAALALFGASSVSAFAPLTGDKRMGRTSITLSAATKPTFNKSTGKWEAKDDTPEYGPVGSLLRHGPNPFIVRVTNPEEYEQAVLKYMASENCSRLEAQGNMDAYFNNAADWAYAKQEEKRTGRKRDYSTLNVKDAALVTIWALFITPLLGRVIFNLATTGTVTGN